MSKDKHENGLRTWQAVKGSRKYWSLLNLLKGTEKSWSLLVAEESTWKFESYDGAMELWLFAGNTLLSLLMCQNGFNSNQLFSG